MKANPAHDIEPATSGMTHDTVLPFLFPAVQRKKVTAAFDGGGITSDGGAMLVAAADRRLGLADKLAAVIAESSRSGPRGSYPVRHPARSHLRHRLRL